MKVAMVRDGLVRATMEHSGTSAPKSLDVNGSVMDFVDITDMGSVGVGDRLNRFTVSGTPPKAFLSMLGNPRTRLVADDGRVSSILQFTRKTASMREDMMTPLLRRDYSRQARRSHDSYLPRP